MKADGMVVCTAVSWFGLWVHELHRVPALLGLTPDGALPMLVVAAGLAWWWQRTHGLGPALALTVYATVNAVTQLPLLCISASMLLRRGYAAGR
jgi:hypothetical protein